MPPEAAPRSDADLQRQRDAIRRSLSRINTVVVAMLLMLAALALAAIWSARRAEVSADLARAAARQAQEELRKSHLTEAQASRFSGRVGSRSESLRALQAAAAIRQSPALRDEAVACLAVTDLETVRWWPFPTGVQDWAADSDLRHYAFGDDRGNVTVYESPNG